MILQVCLRLQAGFVRLRLQPGVEDSACSGVEDSACSGFEDSACSGVEDSACSGVEDSACSRLSTPRVLRRTFKENFELP